MEHPNAPGSSSSTAPPSSTTPSTSSSSSSSSTFSSNHDGGGREVLAVEVEGVPGLLLIRNFVTREEEEEVERQLEARQWSLEIRRRTQQYGFHYSYRYRKVISDEKNPTPPMPEFLDFLLKRFWEWKRAIPFETPAPDDPPFESRGDYTDEEWRRWAPDQTIINSYEPGEEIKPHIDSTDDWAGCVASLSLLDDWAMNFVHSTTKKEIDLVLPRRSLLVLTGDARYVWKHGIKPQVDDRQRRISLTFRRYRHRANDETDDDHLRRPEAVDDNKSEISS